MQLISINVNNFVFLHVQHNIDKIEKLSFKKKAKKIQENRLLTH